MDDTDRADMKNVGCGTSNLTVVHLYCVVVEHGDVDMQVAEF